jgi:hypothetical protein
MEIMNTCKVITLAPIREESYIFSGDRHLKKKPRLSLRQSFRQIERRELRHWCVTYFFERQESAVHWMVNQSSGLCFLMTSLFLFIKYNPMKTNRPHKYQVMIFWKIKMSYIRETLHSFGRLSVGIRHRKTGKSTHKCHMSTILT